MKFASWSLEIFFNAALLKCSSFTGTAPSCETAEWIEDPNNATKKRMGQTCCEEVRYFCTETFGAVDDGEIGSGAVSGKS